MLAYSWSMRMLRKMKKEKAKMLCSMALSGLPKARRTFILPRQYQARKTLTATDTAVVTTAMARDLWPIISTTRMPP